jgi:hypothetical protein
MAVLSTGRTRDRERARGRAEPLQRSREVATCGIRGRGAQSQRGELQEAGGREGRSCGGEQREEVGRHGVLPWEVCRGRGGK